MYGHNLSRGLSWHQMGATGLFLFLLLLFSNSSVTTTTQASSSQPSLPIGVAAGDQFTFKVRYNDFPTVGRIFQDLWYFPQSANQPTIQNDTFQITNMAILSEGNPLCFASKDGCIPYFPIIQFTYTSGNYSVYAVQDFLGPNSPQLIQTTDWAFLQKNGGLNFKNSPTFIKWTETNTYTTKNNNTYCVMHIDRVFNPDTTSTSQTNTTGKEQIVDRNIIFNAQTGVMQYSQLFETYYYPNGTSSQNSYQIVNEAFNGSLLFPTPVTSRIRIPYYAPMFMLIPIAMIRKWLKTL